MPRRPRRNARKTLSVESGPADLPGWYSHRYPLSPEFSEVIWQHESHTSDEVRWIRVFDDEDGPMMIWIVLRGSVFSSGPRTRFSPRVAGWWALRFDMAAYSDPDRSELGPFASAEEAADAALATWRSPLEALAALKQNPVKLSRSYWLGPHRWGAYHTLRPNPVRYVPRPIIARDLAEGYDQARAVYEFLALAYDPRKELNPGALDHVSATVELNEAWALVDSGEKEKAASRYRTLADIATGETTNPNEAANAAERARNLQRKWAPGLGEYQAQMELPIAERKSPQERAEEVTRAFGKLNELLQGKQVKWVGDVSGPFTGEPYIKFGGTRTPLNLPKGYLPAGERTTTGMGRRRVRAAEGEEVSDPQQRKKDAERYAVVAKAAETLLQRKYSSMLWRLMDPSLKQERVQEVLSLWMDPTSAVGSGSGRSVRAQLVHPHTLSFTDAFETGGITLTALRKAVEEVPLGDQHPAPVNMPYFMASLNEVAQYVTRQHIKHDREALGKATRTGEDLFTRPRTPEEILEEQRGEAHGAVRKKRQGLVEDAISALEESGQVGKVKATLLRLHLGQDVLPGQPDRLRGRLDSFGERAYQTSRAWQDFTGDVYRKNRKGAVVLVRQVQSFHPHTEDNPCPTCKAISKFVRVRGMGGKEVAAVIDDFRTSLLAHRQ